MTSSPPPFSGVGVHWFGGYKDSLTGLLWSAHDRPVQGRSGGEQVSSLLSVHWPWRRLGLTIVSSTTRREHTHVVCTMRGAGLGGGSARPAQCPASSGALPFRFCVILVLNTSPTPARHGV